MKSIARNDHDHCDDDDDEDVGDDDDEHKDHFLSNVRTF